MKIGDKIRVSCDIFGTDVKEGDEGVITEIRDRIKTTSIYPNIKVNLLNPERPAFIILFQNEIQIIEDEKQMELDI